MDADGTRPLWPIMDEARQMDIQFFVDNYSNKAVRAEVDSMVYEGGALVGPDAAGYADMLNAHLKAGEDLHSEAIRLHEEALREYLIATGVLPSGDEYSAGRQ